MIRRILLLAAVLGVIRVGLASTPCAVAASDIKHISGTYRLGSDVSEPRPARSRFLETLDGGLVVIRDQVAHYLRARVREKPSAPLYIKIEYQDPLGGPPLEVALLVVPAPAPIAQTRSRSIPAEERSESAWMCSCSHCLHCQVLVDQVLVDQVLFDQVLFDQVVVQNVPQFKNRY